VCGGFVDAGRVAQIESERGGAVVGLAQFGGPVFGLAPVARREDDVVALFGKLASGCESDAESAAGSGDERCLGRPLS